MKKTIGHLLLTTTVYASLLGIAIAGEGGQFAVSGHIDNQGIFVPLRAISEKMQYTLGWDEATQTISVSKGEKVLHLQIGNHDVAVNDHEMVLDSPPKVIDGHTYVPLRFIAENMGVHVHWDQATSTAVLAPIVENPITITTQKEVHDDAGVSVKIQYPQIAGMADPVAQNRINQMLKDRIIAFKKEHMTKLKANAAELLKFGYQDTTMALECNYEVKYNQKGTIRFFFRDYVYPGGPEGTASTTSLTVNIITGQTDVSPDLFWDSIQQSP
ncbi:DUF4163 domain-containing protein [Heliobacterium undosum]|uniref:DUF4163 domain-containing protein n=1 Tax=Heliomicrobium undosum TaxID=121734 RepID=A0A845L8H9_9FIRM|nr:stalk domain-containing protein [Heliomicrobium undosum]MZP29231.1 DUF4163 domain-containing protein [Heliomicrobium undosum]